MKRRTGHKLRLPVRVVDGVVEFEYGGPLPLRHNAIAELIVDPNDVEDEVFLERMTQRRLVKLLPEGAELLVMMSTGSVRVASGAIAASPRLGRWFSPHRFPVHPSFIRIKLGELLPWQDPPDDGPDGGLWLETLGARSIKLISSSIEIPALPDAGWIGSLNHTYTVLSEHFEPQRISHTGNVYEQVLYKERNDLWYPLKLFRDGEIADEEHAIALAFWNDLKAHLAPPDGEN